MWYFTEVADWFEKNRSESDQILDNWVEDSNYNTGVMVAASATKAFTTFGAGFVDLLRLGDGVKEGSLKGIGTDALRFVAIFPVGKAAQMLKSAKGIHMAKFVADPGGPICFWVASAKALRQVGQKFKGRLLIGVEDLARVLGMSSCAMGKMRNLAIGISYLQRLGVKTGPIMHIRNIKDIAKMVPRDGSVVMAEEK